MAFFELPPALAGDKKEITQFGFSQKITILAKAQATVHFIPPAKAGGKSK